MGMPGNWLRKVVSTEGLSIRGVGEATHTRGAREINHIMVSGELAGVVIA